VYRFEYDPPHVKEGRTSTKPGIPADLREAQKGLSLLEENDHHQLLWFFSNPEEVFGFLHWAAKFQDGCWEKCGREYTFLGLFGKFYFVYCFELTTFASLFIGFIPCLDGTFQIQFSRD
jgi:hypothetical protein